MGGLGLVETLGVESRTGGFMVKAMEVAWSELVVRNGGGKAGIGGARWRWEGWNRWCAVEVGRLEMVVLILGMERERERKGAGRGRV